jgi:hypothetical protein
MNAIEVFTPVAKTDITKKVAKTDTTKKVAKTDITKSPVYNVKEHAKVIFQAMRTFFNDNDVYTGFRGKVYNALHTYYEKESRGDIAIVIKFEEIVCLPYMTHKDGINSEEIIRNILSSVQEGEAGSDSGSYIFNGKSSNDSFWSIYGLPRPFKVSHIHKYMENALISLKFDKVTSREASISVKVNSSRDFIAISIPAGLASFLKLKTDVIETAIFHIGCFEEGKKEGYIEGTQIGVHVGKFAVNTAFNAGINLGQAMVVSKIMNIGQTPSEAFDTNVSKPIKSCKFADKCKFFKTGTCNFGH